MEKASRSASEQSSTSGHLQSKPSISCPRSIRFGAELRRHSKLRPNSAHSLSTRRPSHLSGCARFSSNLLVSPGRARTIASQALPLEQYFALDCLSAGLSMDESTGLPVGTTLQSAAAGGFTCGGAEAVTTQGPVLAAVLVVMHVALFVGPLVAIFWLRGLGKQFPQQTAVRDPAMVQASMAVFSLGTLGEIGAHIHDKWYVTRVKHILTLSCALGSDHISHLHSDELLTVLVLYR